MSKTQSNHEPALARGLKSRIVAWKGLLAWKKGSGFIGDNINQLSEEYQLNPSDRGLALEIALGICRQQSLLELQVKDHLQWSKTETELRILLLIAVYQIHFLQSVPNHSVVDTTVEIVKTQVKGGARKTGFMNAVLRKIAEAKLNTPKTSSSKTAALRYSHPSWLAHKWVDELGLQKACLRMKADNMNPVQWIRVRTDLISLEEVAQSLDISEPETRFETYLEVPKPAVALHSELFQKGWISFQDPSSHLVCSMLKATPGDQVLDLCAAPGGKTAWLLERNVSVISCDLKESRLQQMSDLGERLKLPVKTQLMDALKPVFDPQSFSHVLLDAPCSNLGVLGRRPEARWGIEMKDIRETASLQKKLLDSASQLVAPKGVLVYATCSPEPEETIEVVEEFLETHPEFELEPVRSIVGRRYVQGSYLRIIPAPGSLDGFFGARLVRTGEAS